MCFSIAENGGCNDNEIKREMVKPPMNVNKAFNILCSKKSYVSSLQWSRSSRGCSNNMLDNLSPTFQFFFFFTFYLYPYTDISSIAKLLFSFQA